MLDKHGINTTLNFKKQYTVDAKLLLKAVERMHNLKNNVAKISIWTSDLSTNSKFLHNLGVNR